MKFLSIEINNFMAIGEAEISLADRGLVLIQGINDLETSAESNGAGKSTIADALSWCLYGVTARGESGDDVINNDVGKDCSVKIHVEDGNDRYRIVRYRKDAKFKNQLRLYACTSAWHTNTDLTKGTDKLTQEEILKVIGCSVDVFNGAVYAGQEKMPDLPGMTDKNLKMLIEEASGATLLEAAYVQANKDLQARKNAVANAQNLLNAAQLQERNADDRVSDAMRGETEFEVRRLADVRALHANARAKKLMVEAKTDELAKLGDAVIIRQRIEALDKQIADVKSEQEQDRKNVAAFEIASRRYSAAGANHGGEQRKLQNAKQRLAALDHQVGCPCSTCDRPFSAKDIEPAKKLAAAEVDLAENELADAKAELDAALLAMQNAADARDAYRASMTDLTKTNAARASYQAQLDEIRDAERSLANEKDALKRMIEEIKRKRDETNPFTAKIAEYSKLAHTYAAEVAGLAAELENAIAAVKIAESVSKVFSPTGVRAFLLDEVTPFLNDQTAKYLGTLSDGHISATWTTLIKNAKGELREKFSIEVQNENGGKKFGLVSGGEKRKVRIACALALQDLVARRATKPIELFIGDEIDDALDRAGQERLMTILEEKARERGSVFLISHNDLKDWIRNTITVRRAGPRSTIEESAS